MCFLFQGDGGGGGGGGGGSGDGGGGPMDLLQQIQMGAKLRSSTDGGDRAGQKEKEDEGPDLLAQVRLI